MKIVGNEAIFTKEEREIIDRLLAKSDEEQRLYSHDEVWGPILGEEYYKLHRKV